MNLDDELFWSRYTEKFEEAFLPTEEKLKKRYGIGENQKVNANNKTKFEKELRQSQAFSYFTICESRQSYLPFLC